MIVLQQKIMVHLNFLQVGVGLQELLICVEMMLTSIACHYSFSYDPYRPPTGHTVPSPTLVSHAVSPRMMVQVCLFVFFLKHPALGKRGCQILPSPRSRLLEWPRLICFFFASTS